MRLIAVFNHKGGVGKTTTVANLGAALARRDRRVLVVDADPQACLTVHLGIDLAETGPTIYEVLTRDVAVERAVRPVEGEPGMDILPSHLDLAGAEMELATTMGRERILRDAMDAYLREHPEIDYVLYDCPPSLGLLTVNVLCASREVFVPLQTEFLALRGIGKLIEVITLVRRRLNQELRITGIIPTLHRGVTLLGREVRQEIEKHFGDKVFRSVIRTNVRLAEAPSYGQSVFAYDRRAAGAADYEALAEEVEAMSDTRATARPAAPPPEPETEVDAPSVPGLPDLPDLADLGPPS